MVDDYMGNERRKRAELEAEREVPRLIDEEEERRKEQVRREKDIARVKKTKAKFNATQKIYENVRGELRLSPLFKQLFLYGCEGIDTDSVFDGPGGLSFDGQRHHGYSAPYIGFDVKIEGDRECKEESRDNTYDNYGVITPNNTSSIRIITKERLSYCYRFNESDISLRVEYCRVKHENPEKKNEWRYPKQWWSIHHEEYIKELDFSSDQSLHTQEDIETLVNALIADAHRENGPYEGTAVREGVLSRTGWKCIRKTEYKKPEPAPRLETHTGEREESGSVWPLLIAGLPVAGLLALGTYLHYCS